MAIGILSNSRGVGSFGFYVSLSGPIVRPSRRGQNPGSKPGTFGRLYVRGPLQLWIPMLASNAGHVPSNFLLLTPKSLAFRLREP